MLARLKSLIDTPRRKRIAAGSGFILIALLGSVSIFATGPNPEPAVRTEKAWPVSVIEVAPHDMQPTFTAYGRVESSNVTHLKTDLNARVASVHVREGDWVEAGDELITLDDSELQLDLTERRADLAKLEADLKSTRIEQEMVEETTGHYRSMEQVAQKKLKRHQDLMAKRLISQSLLDEVTAQANQATIDYQEHMRALADLPNRLAAAQAAVDRARAQLERVQLDIDKTRITAPFRGPILSVSVAPGDRSMIGATLADIADADAFEVRLQIPERYGRRLQTNLARGQTVTARTEDDRVVTLSRLSGQVRPGQSALDAFFEFPVEAGSAHTALGRLIELTVTLPEEPSVVALPVQSLYENDRIYAIEDAAHEGDVPAHEYRLQAITVERVGEVQSEDGEHRILVRSPKITPGARIITTQLPRAISGLLVEPA
ncbi:MAG: HlyD family efflux transporter periplasmic adaptor subunit [Pseudomonadales bacterium]|jgi:multidrug efflux pump subunit AcrA (membrane-fusion protein)